LPVVGDDEQLLAQRPELADERLSHAFWRRPGGVVGGDAARARREPWAGRMVDDRRHRSGAAARPVDELDLAIRSKQEADADVAARLTAVCVVHRINLPVLVERPPSSL